MSMEGSSMSTCTATIDVGGETLTCTRPADEPHGRMSDERHRDCEAEIVRAVEWTDDAPGATPHGRRKSEAWEEKP